MSEDWTGAGPTTKAALLKQYCTFACDMRPILARCCSHRPFASGAMRAYLGLRLQRAFISAGTSSSFHPSSKCNACLRHSSRTRAAIPSSVREGIAMGLHGITSLLVKGLNQVLDIMLAFCRIATGSESGTGQAEMFLEGQCQALRYDGLESSSPLSSFPYATQGYNNFEDTIQGTASPASIPPSHLYPTPRILANQVISHARWEPSLSKSRPSTATSSATLG